jgi:hypothetical protein
MEMKTYFFFAVFFAAGFFAAAFFAGAFFFTGIFCSPPSFYFSVILNISKNSCLYYSYMIAPLLSIEKSLFRTIDAFL